jgi:hypothetical protein
MNARRPVTEAYLALAWVVVFLAFHVYWYAGGSVARAGALPGMPHSTGGWIFGVAVVAAFPVGGWACVAIARGSLRDGMRRLVVPLIWFGSALLALRGGAGLVDDIVRAIGARHGITGLTIEQVTGSVHPSASELWSGRVTDAYFVAGGLLFGLLADRSRAVAAQARGTYL